MKSLFVKIYDKLVVNPLLILIGVALVVPAFLASLLIGNNPKVATKTWNNGLFGNVLVAYKRYDYKSWARRMVSVYKNPKIVLQYLDILFQKYEVEYVGKKIVQLSSLEFSHDIQTDHQHHRERVKKYLQGEIVESFSPIIVLDNKIQDGHHRVAAMQEAGIQTAEVIVYKKVLK